MLFILFFFFLHINNARTYISKNKNMVHFMFRHSDISNENDTHRLCLLSSLQTTIRVNTELSITNLWAIPTEDKLIFFISSFLENWIWHFMQIASNGGNLHESSNSVFGKNKKISKKNVFWKVYPEC